MNIIEQAIACVHIEGHGYVFAKRFLDTAEKLTEAQAEIDEYRTMLNRVSTFTVIPNSLTKEIRDLLNKGE